MKYLFSLLLLCAVTIVHAQSIINIAGINPEIEAKLLEGDVPSYFEKSGSLKHLNIKVKANNVMDSRNSSYFASYPILKGADGHYAVNAQVEAKTTSRVDLTKDIELIVSIQTIYGNSIWTKVTRTPETISDPIVLDQYTAKAGFQYDPEANLKVSFSGRPLDVEYRKKIEENGDSYKKRTKDHFHFQLKNVGDTKWKIDVWGPFGSVNGGLSMKGSIKNPTEKLDLTKNVIVRGEVKTEKGLILWGEEELTPSQLNKTIYATHYTGTDAVANASDPSTPVEPVTPVTPEPTVESVVTTPVVEEAPVIIGATDLTTKTAEAKCIKPSETNTSVLLNGSTVCVSNAKLTSTGGFSTAKLEYDCNFEIAGTIFPIAGGKQIKYHGTGAYLRRGTLRSDVTVNTKIGTIVLKENSVVVFNKLGVQDGVLSADAEIDVNGTKIMAKANNDGKHDIFFDKYGKIKGLYNANNIVWNTGKEIKIAANSRINFKAGKIYTINLSQPTTLNFEGKEYSVSAANNSKTADIFLLTDKVSSFTSGEGNSVDIQDQNIAIKPNTVVRISNGTTINKFLVASPVTVTVYKGKKEKVVEVKTGKRIVIKEGKIVKAG